MKKIVSVLTAAMLFALSFSCVLAESGGDALGTIVLIRHNIDGHKNTIQKKNAKLLRLSAEEFETADFNDYDTEKTTLGSELYDFSEPSYVPSGKSIEDIIDGGENKINTLPADKIYVHSIEPFSNYPELFANSTVFRTAGGKRAKLICDYSEDVPDYQIVKNKKNIYIENIDFYDFPMIKFENCSNIIINNCTFNDFLDNGVVFRGCSGISVINCSFTDCGSNISNPTCSGYSIRIVGDADAPSENILIENCKIEHSYSNAISFVGAVDDFVVRNNTINNSAWGGIDYWTPDVSGSYINVIENNTCTNIGFGTPAAKDKDAVSSGIGCAAIFAGSGTTMPRSIVKNNTVRNVVETGIEGPYQVVYHNTVRNTGEKSAARTTSSTEAVYIKTVTDYEQMYVDNTIETRGMRCFSSYSGTDDEHKGVYILNNSLNLKKPDSTINISFSRSDIEINCKKLKKLVIRGNEGMQTTETSVNVFIDGGYVMDYFDLDNPCMIGQMPGSARYCFNINNNS